VQPLIMCSGMWLLDQSISQSNEANCFWWTGNRKKKKAMKKGMLSKQVQQLRTKHKLGQQKAYSSLATSSVSGSMFSSDRNLFLASMGLEAAALHFLGGSSKKALAQDSGKKIQRSALVAGSHSTRTESPHSEDFAHLLNEEDILQITTLVNELIDLDFFDEESEQRIFEHCVRSVIAALEGILPRDYFHLVRSSHSLGGIDEKLANQIEERTVPLVQSLCTFPFLDKEDEARIIHFVVKIIVQSMREDRQLEKIENREYAGDLIVSVLMKGAVSKLFDSHARDKMLDEVLLKYHKLFPIVPETTIEFVAGYVLDWAAGHMQDALDSSYSEYLEIHSSGPDIKVDYREILVRQLTDMLNRDIPPIMLENQRKSFCDVLAAFIVENAVDMEKLESIFEYVKNPPTSETEVMTEIDEDATSQKLSIWSKVKFWSTTRGATTTSS